MKKQSSWRRNDAVALAAILGVTALLTSVACSSVSESQTRRESMSLSQPKPDLDSNNVMTRPEGYRNWIFVGTPLTPNELNPPEAPFPEFHNVYIHPDDFEHYARTGEFRDGTVIIKELVSVGSKRATSGVGYFMGEFVGLEAAIKDSRRFADEPGSWAYYSFGHSYPLKDASEPQDTQFCNACHGANADQDWVFTQYYPVLRAAKPTRASE